LADLSTALIAEHKVKSFFPRGFQQATCSQVFLARILKLLDEFIRIDARVSIDNTIRTSTAVIGTFQTIRDEFNQTGRQEVTDPDERDMIDFLLGNTRYVLSRFFHSISLYEAILAKYNESVTEETTGFADKLFSARIEKKWQSRQRRAGLADVAERDHKVHAAQVLNSLTDNQKGQSIVQNCFRERTTEWRKAFESERVSFVPVVTCRICQEKFYANLAKRHGDFCSKKVEWMKQQRANSKLFLQMSENLTNSMLKMKKTMSELGSELSYRRMSIVSSSSFQFLKRFGHGSSDGRKSSKGGATERRKCTCSLKSHTRNLCQISQF